MSARVEDLAVDDRPLHVQLLIGIRLKHNWSQSQLARALMTSRRTIVRWETGESEPPLFVLAALRELLE